MNNIQLILKRIIDFTGSLVGILIFSPIMLIVIILIKLTMPGPVFFKQERVGREMKLFHILKFRTMKVDTEAEKRFDFSKDKDRITYLGHFLRRTKIDELPQLINVLKGDMSLVGPRPTVIVQVEKYSEVEKQRLNMRPGITGLAQVNGNVALDWTERISYDLKYIQNFNLFLDMKILFKTVGIVIIGEDKFKKI